MSEKREDLEGKLSEAATEAHEWKTLMESPGWARLQDFLQSQMNLRQQAVCRTPINMEFSAFAQEFYKGEFNGIELALLTPQTQFDEAEIRRKALVVELEIEDETEADMATASGSRIGRNPFGGEPAV